MFILCNCSVEGFLGVFMEPGRPGASLLLQLVSQDGVSTEPALQTNAVASVESAGLRCCFRVETICSFSSFLVSHFALTLATVLLALT